MIRSDSISLIILDENFRVEELRFDFFSADNLAKQIANLNIEQKFIWIDRCQKIIWLNNKILLDPHTDSCLAIGSLDSSNISIFELAENKSFSRKQISSIFKNLERNNSLNVKRINDMKFIVKYGLNKQESFESDYNLIGNFMIKSATWGWGKTIIENVTANVRAEAERGLTLFGVVEGAPPTPLRHLDTCGHSVESLTTSNYSFQDDILKHGSDFGAFIIIVHDSAVCGQRDLSSLFVNTGLTQFKNIGKRTPYIGLISGTNEVKEYVGDTEQAILIEATNFIRPNQMNRGKNE